MAASGRRRRRSKADWCSYLVLLLGGFRRPAWPSRPAPLRRVLRWSGRGPAGHPPSGASVSSTQAASGAFFTMELGDLRARGIYELRVGVGMPAEAPAAFNCLS